MTHLHWWFIGWSYAVAFVLLAGMTLAIVIDHRAQRRAIEALREEGIERRKPAGQGGNP
jgi:heme exporter protein D